MNYPYRLLAPGPVPMPPEVLKVMGEPIWHHRTPAFEKVLENCFLGLKDVFRTAEPVLILTSTGSGAMEAAIVNTLSPGDTVVCVVGGKFGERWADMCKKYGLDTKVLELEWGKKIDLKKFGEFLKSQDNVKAVLTQVCETSTATLFPVKEMGKIVKSTNSNSLFMVDAITAIGATPVEMDADDIDVVVAGSQKAFMIPTGLSFIAMSKAAWLAYKDSRIQKYYFDLGLELKALNTKQTYFSSSVQLVRALEAALPRMIGANRDKMIDRTARLMTATHAAMKELGLKIYSESPSPSVTAIEIKMNSEKIRDELEQKYNLTVMGGQDKLKGKILRIGHLGFIKNEDLLFFVQSLGTILKTHGEPIADQQIERAVNSCTKALGDDIR